LKQILYTFIFAFVLTISGCGTSSATNENSTSSSFITKDNYLKIAQFQYQQLNLNSVSEHTQRDMYKSPYNPTGKPDTAGTNTLQITAQYSNAKKIKSFTLVNSNRSIKVTFDETYTSVVISLMDSKKVLADTTMDIEHFIQLTPDEYYQAGDAS
jgi:hypothetical protein